MLDEVNVLYIWNNRWRTIEQRGFVPIVCNGFTIDRLLVISGLIHSRSEAQRLVEAGAVSWRRDDGMMNWTKVISWKSTLELGWPWVLRVGNGNWVTRRILVNENSVAKQFPGLALVMRPLMIDGLLQDIDLWSKLWC